MPAPGKTASSTAVRLCLAGFVFVAAAAAVGAWVTGSVEFVFYLVVMAVLGGLVWRIHRRVGFPAWLLAGFVGWAALHMGGGLVPAPPGWPVDGDQRVLYSLWIVPAANQPADGATGYLKYDHLVHAFGFGITTWTCWCGLVAATGAARPTLGLLTLVGTAGLGFGALNEIIEFLATRFTDTNVGGYVNTGYDLISNLTGVLIACVWIRLAAGRRFGVSARPARRAARRAARSLREGGGGEKQRA